MALGLATGGGGLSNSDSSTTMQNPNATTPWTVNRAVTIGAPSNLTPYLIAAGVVIAILLFRRGR